MMLYPDWPTPGHIKSVVTTRGHPPFSDPYAHFNLGTHVGDIPSRVEANRQHLIKQLKLINPPFWLTQTHSTLALTAQALSHYPEADASYTQSPQIVCAVLTADCLPILLTDAKGREIAAIHAGWRGLLNGVIEHTLEKLEFCRDSETLVWFGPAIGPETFEVDETVYNAFLAHDPNNQTYFKPNQSGHWLADIYSLARHRFKPYGIHRFYGGSYCTYTQADLFYSYRRDKVTGRMASLIWMEKL